MRGKQAKKRQISGDRKYNNQSITKLINNLMLDGKKSIAEKFVYGAIETGATANSVEPVVFFEKALENVIPQKHVISRRIGGANYQVPKEIPVSSRIPMAVKMIVRVSRNLAWSKGISMEKVLSNILSDSYKNTGPVVAKKEELHNLAAVNAAFQHFRW